MINIAGVLIYKAGKYLLVQEKQTHVYGLWNIPAGHVEKGESYEKAAKREGEEETGYKLKVGVKIGTFPLKDDAQMHVYKAEVLNGEIKYDEEELLNVGWFSPEEIKTLPLREGFIKELVGT